ncbi:MAG: hypothetical protein JJU11_00635 [Candidatus Sumerlaeia bacterium]|nr:hypothetical protein [Candidatus Sumerlaeia bacterium]
MKPQLLVVFALFLPLIAACSRSAPPVWVGENALPRHGEPLPDGMLEAARDWAAANPQEKMLHQEQSLWALPIVSRKYRLEYDADTHQLAASDYLMAGIGIPYAYLPVRFSFSRYVYTEDGPSPAQQLERSYWPWWSDVYTSGDVVDDTLEAELWGIPLLFEYGSEAGPSWYFSDTEDTFDTHMEFSFWTALWWLGPVWFDQVLTYEEDGVHTVEKGKFFFPLFLGRAPGALLWMSGWSEKESDTIGIERTTIHGPLLGYALYNRTENETKMSHRTLILGGLGWMDSRADDASPRVVGPLWGMFGLSRW